MLAEQLHIVNRSTAFTPYALSSALSQRQTNLEDPKSVYNRPVRLCCDKVQTSTCPPSKLTLTRTASVKKKSNSRFQVSERESS